MSSDRSRARWLLAGWLTVLLASAVILITRLEFSYDLGLFLPPPGGQEQQVLLERLGEAPGSRYIMVAVPEPGMLGILEEELAGDPLFTQILTDTSTSEAESIPDPLWRYRYQLVDTDWSAEGMAEAMGQRVADLTLFAGAPFNQLIQADPVLAGLSVLDRLGGGLNEEWLTDDGLHLLVAETVAPAFDLAGQQQALNRINQVLEKMAPKRAEVSGMGVFGVKLRQTIHSEAQNRSILASVALALVLLLAYRSVAPLWIAAIPLLTGGVLALAGVALIFGTIHGITLAFGFTLLGVAIDYPLHLLSHARYQPLNRAAGSIWPTLRLGAASTILAYLAVALSGSQGLAQLGTFTLVGIAAAAWTTRWIVPLLPHQPAAEPVQGSTRTDASSLRFIHLPVLALIGLVAVVGRGDQGLWSDDLSALSPVPKPLLVRDGELRSALGAPDLRFLIALRQTDLQALLARTGELDQALAEAVNQGWVADYRSASDLLPDRASQQRRTQALPDPGTLQQWIAEAVIDTPFAATAFQPFVDAVPAGDEWVSLVALYQPRDTEALSDWLGRHFADAQLINLRRASESLVADYRDQTLWVLGLALVAILLLLLWRVSVRRALWSVGLIVAVVAATAGASHAALGPLNLYNLMGMLLVSGLGLDYALFLSRPGSGRSVYDTRHSVWACGASTLAAFSVLSLSAIPALESLGTTVAIGIAISLLAARVGVRRSPRQTLGQVAK
jgi:predicted exporter